MEKQTKMIMVKSDTNVKKLADSIYASYSCTQEDNIIVRVIGAGALNQAIKGIIISNKQFVKGGQIAMIMPSFQNSDNGLTSIELKLMVQRI